MITSILVYYYYYLLLQHSFSTWSLNSSQLRHYYCDHAFSAQVAFCLIKMCFLWIWQLSILCLHTKQEKSFKLTLHLSQTHISNLIWQTCSSHKAEAWIKNQNTTYSKAWPGRAKPLTSMQSDAPFRTTQWPTLNLHRGWVRQRFDTALAMAISIRDWNLIGCH